MAVSEYFMMRSEDLAFRRVQFQGKYSFQYIKNAVFEDCVFDTKDEDSMAVSEYFMMRSEDLAFRRVQFQGKYSFQYIKNAVFEDCVFDTKDVFWHGIPII